MKTNVNKFPDEMVYLIIQDYLTTEITLTELKKKYNFSGNDNIYRWMTKFGVSKEDIAQVKLNQIMTPDKEKSSRELELERKVSMLEKELSHEKLKTTALTTLIDIAERDLHIDIRKKRGAKQ